MKKTYVKPGIYVENFTLSQTIAAGGCGIPRNSTVGYPTTADKFSCAWNAGSDVFWVESSICRDAIGPDVHVDIGCYNNPNSSNTAFGYS